MPIKQSYYVSTIGELANYNSSHSEIIFVNDKVRTSGNPFRWAANTLKVNGGTVQQGADGVWEMMFSGPVNVNWFGAVADGSDVTTKFQNAVDYAFQIARPVYVPGSTGDNVYRLGQINLYDNSIIFGDYRRSIITPTSSRVTKIFNIEGEGFSKGVKTFNNLYCLTIVNQLQHGPITTGCVAINARFCDELHLRELVIDGFDINLNIENSSNVYVNKVRCRGASRNNARITWKKETAPFVGTWIFMTECEFNGANFSHAATKEKFSVYIENMASVTMDKNVIAGNFGGGIKFVQSYMQPAVVKDMGYIVITGCDIDSNHGVGIRGEYSRNCVIKGNWISSGRENLVSGIDLNNCESSSITDNQVFYCGFSGIEITNSRYINVSSNMCQGNGVSKSRDSAGIRISNSRYNTFANNICNSESYGWGATQTNGITSELGSDNNIFTSNVLIPGQIPIKANDSNNKMSNNSQ